MESIFQQRMRNALRASTKSTQTTLGDVPEWRGGFSEYALLGEPHTFSTKGGFPLIINPSA